MIKSEDRLLHIATPKEINLITEYLRLTLKDIHTPFPVSWILQAEPTELDLDIDPKTDLSKLILNVDFVLSNNKRGNLESQVRVNKQEIERIALQTVGQFKNEIFRSYKRLRLTASNLGFVIAAIQRNRFPPSLFGRLLNEANLDKVSMQCDSHNI